MPDPFTPVSRRQILTLTAAAWVAGTTRRLAAETAPLTADQLVSGKSAELKVIESSPIVLETPLSRLASSQITPVSHLFVRNNQDLEGANTTAALDAANWTLDVAADEGPVRKLSLAALQSLPQTTVQMVLQCSGNSRYRFAETSPVKGTPWGDGGVGNVEFGGVRLSTVLAHLKVQIPGTTTYLLAQGQDKPKPGKDDFEHSLPIGDVLGRSILATTLNGQPIPAIHGGPLRLITPGYFGTMQVKWLSRIGFTSEESANDYHASKYRMPLGRLTPGSDYTYARANSRAGWKMNIKSLVLLDADARFPVDREVTLSGVAFNDGACPIETVLISLDRGMSWRPVPLERPESAYAWSRWTWKTELPVGPHEVWSRAIDEMGRSQPIDGARIWNPAGYEFNAVDRKRFVVS